MERGHVIPMNPVDPDAVLTVRNMKTEFALRTHTLKAVDDVSFTLKRGKTLCIVGESGSGKSVTARSILRIVPEPGKITGGDVILHREDGDVALHEMGDRSPEIRAIRGADIAMIFQEPMSSLSPVHTIGFQIEESLILHTNLDQKARRARVVELLRRVEIPDPERTADRYPFEYSGGMRQRAMIAMALACNPKVLIADEPTTALDVTTQAEILDLIQELQDEYGMAVMFITHDMGVVAEIADEVAVMYRGQHVESGTVEDIFANPREDYTKMLIGSAVRLEEPSPIKIAMQAKQAAQTGQEPILEVRGLVKQFAAKRTMLGKLVAEGVRAVNDVSFDLMPSETLGVVGESGSGKTTLGRCIMRMHEPTSGQILYRGRGTDTEITGLDKKGLRDLYADIRMIFQDPYASLNPRMTVEQLIGEPLRNRKLGTPAENRDRVADLLVRVGLKPEHMERYPHAFSGGQRQRIGIARALAPNPKLIIADEATSALDVSLRSQILDLLLEFQESFNLSFIFISHDISTVRYFCDRVAVMYRGEVVEIGNAREVCDNPTHAYTKALLSAVPRPDPTRRRIADRHRYVAKDADLLSNGASA